MATQQWQQRRQHQGVLWKRRDVFKNRWRPRWFILNPDQCVLTYYLLSSDTNAASSTISIGTSNSDNDNTESTRSMNVSSSLPTQTNNISSPSSNRRRTMSESSVVSQNSVDYDVVPRGTIYLLGCSVEPNSELTRPRENLYAFTITPPPSNTETRCHLAANTPELRAKWVQRLIRICTPPPRPRPEPIPTPTPSPNETTTTTTTTTSVSSSPSSIPPSALSSQATPPAASDMGGSDALEASTMPTSATAPTKWEYAPDSVVFENVPDQIVTRIQTMFGKYIPLCQSNLGWTKLFDKDGVEAHTRSEGALQVVKSTTILPQHPRQIFNLLLNPQRRLDYETNIRNIERLKWYNQHTFLDYFSTHPVWPTSARDFAVVLHWQVLEQQIVATSADDNNSTKESAVCMIAFSCPEADHLRQPQPDHVRGDLKIILTLLRTKKREGDGNVCCHMTRLLSYDLCGSIPYNLTNTILLQQANLPRVIKSYLQQFEPQPPERLKSGSLTTDDLMRDVANHLDLHPQRRRRISFDDRSDSIEIPDSPTSATGDKNTRGKESTPVASELSSSLSTSSTKKFTAPPTIPTSSTKKFIAPATKEDSPPPSLLLVATILCTLVCFYYMSNLWFVITSTCAVAWVSHSLSSFTVPSTTEKVQAPSLLIVVTILLTPVCFYHLEILPFNELCFVITTIYAVRSVVLLHLGTPLVNARNRVRRRPPMGAMTCRFSVDLKGVLRFIANKKEEKLEQMKGDNEDISVTHIVVCALARAMAKKKKEFWNCNHVSIPYLGIDDYYPDDSINISVTETMASSGSSTSSCNTSIITIPKADEYDVQQVADYLATAAENNMLSQREELEEEIMNPLSLITSMVGLKPDSSEVYGKCIVYTTPDSDHCEVDIDAGPVDGVTVTVVVSGIRLIRNGSGAGPDNSPIKAIPPKPTLSMSITINCPFADVNSCRQFAEDVEKLVQFPEMCDEKQ